MVPHAARRRSAQPYLHPGCEVRRFELPVRLPPFRMDDHRKRGGHSGAHVGPFARGRSFLSGEMVKETGIYEVNHRSDHRAEHEVVLLNGDTFPPCETCAGEVRFRLIRTAPYIFQDEDFEEN